MNIEESSLYFPGGVNSPVRSFKTLQEKPFFTTKSEKSYLYSDEKKFLDFCLCFGVIISEHRDPDVLLAVTEALKDGWIYGTCEPYSYELAKYIITHIPFLEKIRFMNSGTEAVMTALRIARASSRKESIIKFKQCYHGHADSMLVSASSALQGSSAGVHNPSTIILDKYDLNLIEETFKTHLPGALIIEPLPANNGLTILSNDFLENLLKLCQKYKVISIFDEVISGFRCSFGGISSQLSIQPDLITYGKILGGGFPIGALAGKKKLLDLLAPEGNVYQAGTFSANPFVMRAGLALLKKLNSHVYSILEKTTQEYVNLFKEKFQEDIISKDSLFWINCSSEKFQKIFTYCFNKGIYLSPHVAEVNFLSLSHKEALEDFKNLL